MLLPFFSRRIFTEYAADTSTETLKVSLQRIINQFPNGIKELNLDRQSGFASAPYTTFMTKAGINYSFIPPNRHEFFGSYVERCILTLRNMSRMALTNSGLSPKFWKFATTHACYVYNSLPHSSLRQSPFKTPFEAFLGKSYNTTASIRVFGSLCYKLTPIGMRKNKYQEISKRGIFLGMDNDSSPLTAWFMSVDATIRPPKLGRTSHVTLQDLYFTESKFIRDVVHETRFLPPTDSTIINKFSKFNAEVSDDDSSYSSEGDNSTPPSDPSTDAQTQQDPEPSEEPSPVSEPPPASEPYRTRTGRVTGRRTRRFSEETFMVVETNVINTHKQRHQIPAQKKKFLQKMKQAKEKNVPMNFSQVKGHPNEDKYMAAIAKEIDKLSGRNVIKKSREIPLQ